MKMNYSSILILILGFLSNYAHSLESESIVGGDEAAEGQFKYQVSVETRRENPCSGGIIGDRHVLTAAHCMVKSDGTFVSVSLIVLANTLTARVKYDPNVVRVDVEEIYVPKAYQPEKAKNTNGPYRTVADIAVLKLTNTLGLCKNPNLVKLSLPQPHHGVYPTYVDSAANVAGYGYNYINLKKDHEGNDVEDGGGSDHILRFGRTKVVANDVCQKTKHLPIYKTHMCAQMKQRDPKVPEGVCSGDSGSPLVYDGMTVIGVLSASPHGCNENTSPGVYTRVSSYVKFIQNAMDDKVTSDMRAYVMRSNVGSNMYERAYV